MTDDFDFEPLLTATEVARLLKFSPKHIRNLAATGELPGVKFRSEWRFRRSDLKRAVEEAIQGNSRRSPAVELPRPLSMTSVTPPPATVRRGRGRPRKIQA